MPDAVYQVMTMLCGLVAPLPIGTNLGLLHLLWMLASGRLLASRGAVFPGLADCGLSARAVRRAWAALGQGGWTSARLLARWAAAVAEEGRWQPHRHGGYRPVAVDVTGFWRPRLRECATSHYHGAAGRALPAIPVGLVARAGSAAGQRLALPLAFVRADGDDPSPAAAVRERRRAGAGCRLRGGAAPGGGRDPLCGARGHERHLPPCYAPAVWRPGPPANSRGRGASAPARLQGAGHPRDAARPHRDVARG
jgi:hypothetical protein